MYFIAFHSAETSQKSSTPAPKGGASTCNKRKRKTKGDKIAESMATSIDRFVEEQRRFESRFVDFEEKRMKMEEEADIRRDRLAEQRRREEREHEYRIMNMMMQVMAGRQIPQINGMMSGNPLETGQVMAGGQMPQMHGMTPGNLMEMGQNLMSEIPSHSSTTPPSYYQLS